MKKKSPTSIHAGPNLKLLDLRESLTSPNVSTVYTTEDDVLTSLAVFDNPSPFLALASKTLVILLDSRKPHCSVLKWTHSKSLKPADN